MRPLFGWRNHAFRRSALSSSVPLDGSETVVGLRQWNRHLRGKDLNDYLQNNLAGLQGLGRTGYRHYKGPYLDQLSRQDLQHLPVPWLLSLCGGDLRTWAQAYNLPEHSAMLQERLEENLVRYRGNYIRLAAAAALLVTVFRPWALFGVLCLCTLFFLNTAQPLEDLAITRKFERITESLVPSELQGASAHSRMHGAATILLYILTLYSSCFTMLPRWKCR
ncbi:hypothetical protein WJX73_005182 [Symbiochloris irregularis]|uniref:PRA1 family protein n=1 Tax=Symbiochloris irregularis TaxID=706552 RepID=A0AAW1P1B4_9CHLO